MFHRPTRMPGLIAGMLLAGSLAACDPGGLRSAEHAGPFPHESPSDAADVSLDQALSDYGVRLPEGAEDIAYGALKALDGYPFNVQFSVPCDAVAAFVRDNRLASAGRTTPDEVLTEVIDAGFTPDSGPAYVRAKGSKLPKVTGAVFERSSTCRVFLAG
ncbi:hypothetical protein FNH09_06480 [Streptomyces adustus]|uniref:Lipoprotein n=1 Tax=Streptomyces adustus TaxID=1609272 RepID=A0A5N8V703_9ACTN|nr:hypothetical protein [Streptomyces adustus]MPY30973.1 hypothetical protein [Streptomyces adustus]